MLQKLLPWFLQNKEEMGWEVVDVAFDKQNIYNVSLTLHSGEMLIVVDSVLRHWPVSRMTLNGGF